MNEFYIKNKFKFSVLNWSALVILVVILLQLAFPSKVNGIFNLLFMAIDFLADMIGDALSLLKPLVIGFLEFLIEKIK